MKKKNIAVVWTLGPVVLCALFAMATPVYNGDADNYIMALVSNKLFTGAGQETYISYLNPVLCKIFEGIGAIFPTADCFTLTAFLMLLAAIAVSAYTVYTVYTIGAIGKTSFGITGYYVILIAIVILRSLFNYNFTGWAGFLSAVGVWILLLMLHGKLKDKWVIAAVFFLSCGLMWRYEAVLVFVPYVLLDASIGILFAEKNNIERKSRLKKAVFAIGIPVLCVSMLALCHYGTLHLEKYQEAKAYDDARCAVVDYPLQNWEAVKEELPDMTENDYNSVKKWILMDTERVDTEFLIEMGNAGQTEGDGFGFGEIIRMQKQVIGILISTEYMLFLSGLAVLLFLTVMLSSAAWYYKLQTIFIYLGTDIICLFFVFAGRAIERVFMLICYALLVSVGVLLLTELRECENQFFSWGKKAVAGFGILGLCYGVMNAEYVPNQSVFTAKEAVNITEYREDELYIWNIGAYVNIPMKRFADSGKLMPVEYTKHHIYEGAWVYGQLYFEQLLESVNAKNPMRALLERKNTYYVAYECGNVLTYLQEHFSKNTTVICVGELEGVPVWKFDTAE